MNRLQETFAAFSASRRRALIPYITAGYPDYESTIATIEAIDPAKCACLELGIPFSDPIADGPVIQTSFSRALAGGFRLDPLLAALRAARDRIRVPLAAMVSYSIVYRRGPKQFVANLVAAGVDGLIVPDVSIEEADELAATVRQGGASLIMIAAPTSDAQRLARIAAVSDPFVYYQCVAGVTGERGGLPLGLAEQVANLHNIAKKPVCVGFGIGTAAQVADVCKIADGAIVGSAIVRRMNAAFDAGRRGREFAVEIGEFIQELASGVS